MRTRSPAVRLAAGTALSLAGAALAVVSGSAAAHAAVVNATTAAPAGTVSAVAVATCPAGQFLSGGGGAILNGGGDVTLTDVIPDVGAGTVTVWGHSNPGAAPAAYTVRAQAICLPAAVPANYQRVASTSANNADPIKNQVVACPAGTRLLGLGAELRGADGNVFYQRIQPNAGLTAGAVTAGASGGFAGSWQLTAYAICATTPAALAGNLVGVTGPSNSTAAKNQAAGGCPIGAVATGVGGAIEPTATGNVLLTGVLANAAQNDGAAGAEEDGVYLPNWDLTGYAICWG